MADSLLKCTQMRKRAYKVGAVYQFVWKDHTDHNETWSQLCDIDMNAVVKMQTIGLCIDDGVEYLTVAGTVEIGSDNPLYSQVFRCLKSDIVRAKEIKL